MRPRPGGSEGQVDPISIFRLNRITVPGTSPSSHASDALLDEAERLLGRDATAAATR